MMFAFMFKQNQLIKLVSDKLIQIIQFLLVLIYYAHSKCILQFPLFHCFYYIRTSFFMIQSSFNPQNRSNKYGIKITFRNKTSFHYFVMLSRLKNISIPY